MKSIQIYHSPPRGAHRSKVLIRNNSWRRLFLIVLSVFFVFNGMGIPQVWANRGGNQPEEIKSAHCLFSEENILIRLSLPFHDLIGYPDNTVPAPGSTTGTTLPKLLAEDPNDRLFGSLRKRISIDTDQLVYFEKLTRGRVRIIHYDGSCSIQGYAELVRDIKEQRAYGHIQAIPRDGLTTEFVNLHYIESFEMISSPAKERYVARLSVENIQFSPLRYIEESGVGPFSHYIYRKLRILMEQLNPHVDYKYRRTTNTE